jgi:transposase-like protein
MEKIEKVEKLEKRTEEKRGRRGLGHTAEEKCQAVLSIWTERRKPGEVCRELGVTWGILKQWQDRAMEGVLQALEPRVKREREVALSPRLAVLLEKKSQAGMLKGLDRRLKKLQGSLKASPEVREASTEKKL